MVKKTFLILSAYFTLAFGHSLIAGEFTANVNNTQLHLSESFSLNLTLKDTSSNGTPDFSSLKENFLIQSQHHLSNTTILNGKISSNITWKLSLMPKQEGVLEIPSITIDTAEGILSTQPIKLNITKSVSQTTSDINGPKITTKVSNSSPYKNEPLVYTASLTSKIPLYNLQTQKLQMQDAIVELIEEPRLEEKLIDGSLLNVVEFTYLITPLKADSLKIPSIIIQGALPQKRKNSFDDDLDPFSMMQGFDLLKPFTLMTEEIQLQVQPAISGISPWLPAKAIDLQEQWPNDKGLRVGEPFSRSIIIRAEGVKASQLPHLEDLQNLNSPFKIYSDKPEEQENILEGMLHSIRKEQYTFIPQQSGTQTLPELSITWWDTTKKEKRISSLPARTVTILPPLEAATFSPHEPALKSAETTKEIATGPIQSSFFLYAIIGILSFLLLTALVWGFTLHRKIVRLTPKPAKPELRKKIIEPAEGEFHKSKKEKLPDLNPT